MDILFVTPRTAFQDTGGGSTQVLQTQQVLQSRSHNVDIFSPTDTVISDYDLAHTFSTSPDVVPVVSEAKKNNIPIVLSPIYIDPIPGLKITSDYVGMLKYSIKRAAVRSGIQALDPVAKLCNKSNIILPNSQTEAEKLSVRYDVSNRSMQIIPNGVESRFADAEPDIFLDKYDFDRFVLFVCTPSPIKNLKLALPALESLRVPSVIIGPSDSPYANQVKSAAPSANFLGEFPHNSELLESAYAAASAFALPSLYETVGLAALEAGLSGTNLAVSKNGGPSEYVGEYAEVIDPTDSVAIREGVERALEAGDEQAERLQSHISKNYSWSRVGKLTERAYERALNA